MSSREEYRYNHLTWPEINEAIGQQKLVLLPTGSTEQHGRHLPLDTDVFLAESVCLEVGRRAKGKVLVLPPISCELLLMPFKFVAMSVSLLDIASELIPILVVLVLMPVMLFDI